MKKLIFKVLVVFLILLVAPATVALADQAQPAAEQEEGGLTPEIRDLSQEVADFGWNNMAFSDTREEVVIEDESYSMTTTFSWERGLIRSKLADCEFDRREVLGFPGGTDLWEKLNSIEVGDGDVIVLVSDLWDTTQVVLEEAQNRKLAVFVPYYSTDKEAVEHTDECANYILSQWSISEVGIIYLDDIVYLFRNTNPVQPVRPVAQPEPEPEQLAIDTAVSIAEQVEIDEAIPRDSVVVFDVSGSMEPFMKMVYDQLHEMVTSSQIEAMIAFATSVSREFSPEELRTEWKELWRLGEMSNIRGGLQKATRAYSDAHIYILTDLYNNEGRQAIDRKFGGAITVLEYGYGDVDADNFYEEIVRSYPNAESVERISAN